MYTLHCYEDIQLPSLTTCTINVQAHVYITAIASTIHKKQKTKEITVTPYYPCNEHACMVTCEKFTSSTVVAIHYCRLSKHTCS